MASRRAVMTLFSAPNEPQSHRVRIVLAEKANDMDVISVVPGRYPEDLLDLNPYRSLPTLVDRDLVLYDARVIIDYLDERFPHPPLMPVDPVLRAQFRLAMYRIERDWYGLADQIERESDRKNQARLKKELRDAMLESADLFKIKPYFLSDEFSVVDATIAPILWRMRRYEIELPPQAQAMSRYAATILARPTFRASLSDAELEMGLGG
jgi:RNA polymerase-associated protein